MLGAQKAASAPRVPAGSVWQAGVDPPPIPPTLAEGGTATEPLAGLGFTGHGPERALSVGPCPGGSHGGHVLLVLLHYEIMLVNHHTLLLLLHV